MISAPKISYVFETDYQTAKFTSTVANCRGFCHVKCLFFVFPQEYFCRDDCFQATSVYLCKNISVLFISLSLLLTSRTKYSICTKKNLWKTAFKI